MKNNNKDKLNRKKINYCFKKYKKEKRNSKFKERILKAVKKKKEKLKSHPREAPKAISYFSAETAGLKGTA